jgi:hypothetical protein
MRALGGYTSFELISEKWPYIGRGWIFSTKKSARNQFGTFYVHALV